MIIIVIIVLTVLFLLILGSVTQNKETRSKIQQQMVKTDALLNEQQIRISKDIKYYMLNDIQTVRIVVDADNRNIHIFDLHGNHLIIPFDRLMGCDVFQDKQVVGGIKRAVVGGLLAGGAGAVVGTMTAQSKITSMNLIIYQDDLQTPQIPIGLIVDGYGDIQRATAFANEVISTFNVIIKQEEAKSSASTSNALIETDQLRKLKDLLDEGIITQEEFEEKKRKILGL